MSLSGGPGRIIVTVDPDLEDLVPGFLDHRRADVQAIRDALQQRDYRTIHRLGHNLRGDSGALGFHELTIIGRNLESAALDQDEAGISAGAQRLADYLERVDVVCEDTSAT